MPSPFVRAPAGEPGPTVTQYEGEPDDTRIAALLASSSPQALERFEQLDADASHARAADNGLAAEVEAARREVADQVARHDNFYRQHAGTRAGSTPEFDQRLAEYAAGRERSERKLEAARQRHREAADGRSYRQALVSIARRGLGQVVAERRTLEVIEVKLPRGAAAEVVEKQRAAIAQLDAQAAAVKAAKRSPDELKREAAQAIRQAAEQGKPQVRHGGRTATVRPPVHRLHNVESRDGGTIPSCPDAWGLACWLHTDAIIAEAHAQIDEQYADAELILDERQKAQRLKDIAERRLAAERVECEAVWQARAAGDQSLDFRADIDWRALLGVAPGAVVPREEVQPGGRMVIEQHGAR